MERDWDEIDVGPKLQRLSDIDEQLQQLREGDSGLRALGQAIDTARTLRDQAKRTYEDVRLERAQLARERVRLEQQQAACAGRAGTAALTPTQLQGLQERLAALAPLSLDNLEAHFRVVERGLAEQLAESQGRDSRLSAQLLECFRRYCQQWPEDSGDFTVSLASADDFLARLDRLESDGLPRHEHRFFDLLQTQSKNNLLALQRHTAEAHKGIKQRMDEVNASLEQVPFNRDTILTIEVSDRRLAEVQEFQQQLRAVLSHQQTEDRALAEAQFATLRTLVARLGAQEPEARAGASRCWMCACMWNSSAWSWMHRAARRWRSTAVAPASPAASARSWPPPAWRPRCGISWVAKTASCRAIAPWCWTKPLTRPTTNSPRWR